MLRELMQRTRIARWLADLGVWVLILGAALFVGTWWTEHGTAVVQPSGGLVVARSRCVAAPPIGAAGDAEARPIRADEEPGQGQPSPVRGGIALIAPRDG